VVVHFKGGVVKADNRNASGPLAVIDKFRAGPLLVMLLVVVLSLTMTSCAMLAANAAY